MKIWAVVRKNNKIIGDLILENGEVEALIFQACEHFDIGKPLILTKNETELNDFRRTVFYSADFIEPISFDTFEIEIIDEDKNK